ncbi:MAG: HAD-IA family hydrolase [Treponema sp.]|jgi:HAD superfamily hydrolase (TIGR01509 family)|nr:HAD-IA family hydrolase [Treponema sp.]
MKIQALLFDCDGVLAETERDGHRVAYNRAMKELGIDAEWDEKEYGDLVLISGGKERLKNYFNRYPFRFPSSKYNDDLIQEVYLKKTGIFKNMANNGSLPPRSGIARIIREAHEAGILLFICSTSHLESVKALLSHNYGEECLAWFTKLYCGDVVTKKKPAPDIYLLAKNEFNLDGRLCFVIEDSRNGLLAARGAGMHCIVTQSFYTVDEDFSEADITANCLGDPVGERARILNSTRPIPERGYITAGDLELLL